MSDPHREASTALRDADEALRRAAILLIVDELAYQDLSAIAVEALVQGLDSPALRDVAGMPAFDAETRDRFVLALGELGIAVPDKQSALWSLVRENADAIIAGRVPPHEGARAIGELRDHVEREGDLRIFVGLASEWDYHPEHRREIDQCILDAARELAGRGALRRWLKVEASGGGWPLWEGDRRLARDELPLSASLQDDIARWVNDFDATQRGSGAGPSKFATQADAEAFVRRGAALVARAQTELGDDGWHVEYAPTPSAFPAFSL